MDFLRRAELVVGPLADWQGGGSSSNAIRIIADGSSQRLRVAFSSQKTLTGDPNKTEISVFNLSPDTRQALRSNLTKVQLLAGYESSSDSVGLVATGALMGAISTREGADIVTRLTVLDGYGGMVRGAYSKSFSGGTDASTVVRDLATSMPGVTVGRIDVDGRLFSKGLQLSGATTSQLDKLADQFGFSWSVQDGFFQAISDKRDSGTAFSFDSETNLISAVPVLNGPLMVNVGIEVQAKFDARIKPGDRMIVRSRVNPQLNGSYKATSVALSFDSHGPASVRVQSLKLF